MLLDDSLEWRISRHTLRPNWHSVCEQVLESRRVELRIGQKFSLRHSIKRAMMWLQVAGANCDHDLLFVVLWLAVETCDVGARLEFTIVRHLGPYDEKVVDRVGRLGTIRAAQIEVCIRARIVPHVVHVEMRRDPEGNSGAAAFPVLEAKPQLAS